MSAGPGFRALPPGKTAIIMGTSGRMVSYGELERRSNKGAHLLRALGLGIGDVLAICIENAPEFFDVACAAQRSGVILVPVSTRLTAGEVEFIVRDSGAKLLVISPGIETPFETLAEACNPVPVLMAGGFVNGAQSWEQACERFPGTPIRDEAQGGEMLYSSGTTGRPKGIRYHGAEDMPGAAASGARMLQRLGIGGQSVYLSPAPLYHSAPFAWALAMLGIGATVVVMESFEAEEALALIERYKVDASQWVPTHFVRLLKLPDAVRARHDISSLKIAVHAAAPCPVPVKKEMIDWWGPILLEYFGSSEQTALTLITSEEWLAHPGSVGRCFLGKLHICDGEGRPLPAGETGLVYSEGGMVFSYHGDAARTAQARNDQGWTCVGDIGHLDEEGYLYLTDRQSFMIITGGVNVYPQEIENLLVTHPAILDAAVIGAPDDDLGEVVTAVIQLTDKANGTQAFTRDLLAWMRKSLSGVKVPKYILYRDDLPRLPTGKMAKHQLRREIAEAFRQGIRT